MGKRETRGRERVKGGRYSKRERERMKRGRGRREKERLRRGVGGGVGLK